VFDTPLAESGIIGLSIGLAMGGLHPVPEIQFEGFLGPAYDQICSHAARMRSRTRGAFTVPMTIRIPVGGGIHAPELHSDSPEAIYAHTPGLQVVMPSSPYDAKGLLVAALRDPDPVLYFEPKRIYRAFREDAVKHKFRHFLEVFNPNAPQKLDPKVMPFYVNDMIMRVLAGMAGVERPLFLKMPFNGRKAMEELASHDPNLVIGILGGSAGTTRDCFELLSQGEKSGARVALFGRKINLAESPLDLVALFRPVLERKVTAAEAVKSYHATLAKKKLKPKRALEDDMKITEAVLEGYGK
jgi:hypothetical protein